MTKRTSGLILKRTTASHVETVLADLSPISAKDVEKCLVSGYDFKSDMLNNKRCLSIIMDDKPCAVIKIPNADDINDIVWVMLTNEAMKQPFRLHRETFKMVRLWVKRFGGVRTTCIKTNKVSIRWLLSLGFAVIGQRDDNGDFVLEAN
ncbi:hypothetical protein BJAS_P3967 [Bathymodiolus japonicus methanotrophic gill symbiont]|uniref:hypothetical protein n=1 Tax=Bathymodiolus japonicus methanotrophic gill symbiont TaxID=113269 RepID=UPI001B43066F|nr:hypothetical protein [Bathymodiolus japonicus methanotrophic gill symbiont]GFO73255.1 hypothetical protein BJAS_P3967 [Bathymodiolus japonicus methanotrophic gill symbiont]